MFLSKDNGKSQLGDATPSYMANIAQRAKNVKVEFKPLLAMLFSQVSTHTRLPTPAISQTSAAVLSEFLYKILALSSFATSVRGRLPVMPHALADVLPAEVRSARSSSRSFVDGNY